MSVAPASSQPYYPSDNVPLTEYVQSLGITKDELAMAGARDMHYALIEQRLGMHATCTKIAQLGSSESDAKKLNASLQSSNDALLDFAYDQGFSDDQLKASATSGDAVYKLIEERSQKLASKDIKPILQLFKRNKNRTLTLVLDNRQVPFNDLILKTILGLAHDKQTQSKMMTEYHVLTCDQFVFYAKIENRVMQLVLAHPFYELSNKSGEGTTCRVTARLNVTMGRYEAFKQALVRNHYEIQRNQLFFQNEAQLLGRVSHLEGFQSKPSVFFNFNWNNEHVIALSGKLYASAFDNLRAIPLSMRSTCALCTQLLRAMVEMHTIIKGGHGDLKLENLLQPDNNTLVIGDLAASITLQTPLDGISTFTRIFTPRYVSPYDFDKEHAIDFQHFTVPKLVRHIQSRDVYALGCLFFELFTIMEESELFYPMVSLAEHATARGIALPNTNTQRDVIAIKDSKFNRACLIRYGCPEPIIKIIEWMLTQDPAKRPHLLQVCQPWADAVELGLGMKGGATSNSGSAAQGTAP